MQFQIELSQTLNKTPACLDGLSELIDLSWIEQALAATGKASIRRRRLPAEHVVWLVIGLALFRNQPIWHVVRQLDLVLDSPKPVCAPSAAVQGRQRLGGEPLAHLFGVGSWPQIRAVCLMDTHSHELMDAQLGAMSKGELTLAADLAVPDQSLTVFDRAYFSAAFLLNWQTHGCDRHWLMRAKDNLRDEVVATHAPGDCTVRMPLWPRARKLAPELPLWWQARLIEVTLAGRTRRFITSLCDPKRYPAKQLAALYCQRWEIELGFREIKQSFQANSFVLRSKQPALVRQEIWGVRIAYTLLHRQMRLMAQHLMVAPVRIGLHVASIAIIELLRFAPLESAATLPKRLALLYEQADIFLLPPRRPRSCPRVVKHKASK